MRSTPKDGPPNAKWIWQEKAWSEDRVGHGVISEPFPGSLWWQQTTGDHTGWPCMSWIVRIAGGSQREQYSCILFPTTYYTCIMPNWSQSLVIYRHITPFYLHLLLTWIFCMRHISVESNCHSQWFLCTKFSLWSQSHRYTKCIQWSSISLGGSKTVSRLACHSCCSCFSKVSQTLLLWLQVVIRRMLQAVTPLSRLLKEPVLHPGLPVLQPAH